MLWRCCNLRITVCRDCTDRHLGCHDHCDRYQTQKKKNDEARERYVEWKDVDAYFAKRSIAIKKRAKIE